jgi:hypothetical protein
VAGAQETTLESDDDATIGLQDGTDQQPFVFAEGEQTVRAHLLTMAARQDPYQPTEVSRWPCFSARARGK